MAQPGPPTGPETPQVHRVDGVFGPRDRIHRERRQDGHEATQPGDGATAPRRRIVPPNSLGVDRLLELGRQGRQESERQVHADRELLRDPEAGKRDPEIRRSHTERNRKADGHHRHVAHPLRRRV